MNKAPNPPSAPDPSLTASEQTRSNVQTAIANAMLNRVNQSTPWGSITYTQGAPDANGIPTWTSQISLSPEQQALFEQQQSMQGQRNTLAQSYLGQIGAPLDFSHLHPLNERGQMYTGAVNATPAPQPSPQATGQSTGQSLDPQMLAEIAALLGLGGSSSSASGNPLARSGAPATQPASASTAPAQSMPASSGNVNINAGAPGNPLDQLLAGRNPYGSLGGMVVPLAAGYTTEGGDTVYGQGEIGPNDPRAAQATQDLSNYNGTGVEYSQVRNNNIGGPGQVIDPSKVVYDPKYGLVSPTSNFKHFGTDIGDWGPFAIAAIPAVAAAAGALGGGAASGSAGAIPEGSGVYTGGGFVDDPALIASGGGQIPDAAALSGASNFAPVSQGATPIAGANPPTIWQQMENNFMGGRGLFGLSPVQRAGVGLLPQILRAMSSRNQQTGGH